MMDRLFDPMLRPAHPSRPPGWEDLVKPKAFAEGHASLLAELRRRLELTPMRPAPLGGASPPKSASVTLGSLNFSRAEFGATPADYQDFLGFGSDDSERLEGWVDWQLDPESIPDGEFEARLAEAGYETTTKNIYQLWIDHMLQFEEPELRYQPIWESINTASLRALYSRRQLAEVLADFWHNHFNVYGFHDRVAPVFPHYDREVIRTHMLGNFRDFLEAVTTSPAMAFYLDNPEFFTFSTGPWLWVDEQRAAMEQIYGLTTSAVNAAGLQSMNAVDIVATHVTGDYVPAGDAVYSEDEAGGRFMLAAQMLSLDLGIQVVTIDLGSWDTHENQGTGPSGQFSGLVGSLSSGLSAFMTDMEARGVGERLTVVVMTEFGRRLTENGDEGTDHGHAVPMLVLGANVVGGLHGAFPGLAPAQLFEGVDLEVTADYRQVLSEILIKRLSNRRIGEIFPGYTGYEALGIVQGADLPPIYTDVRGGGSGRVSP